MEDLHSRLTGRISDLGPLERALLLAETSMIADLLPDLATGSSGHLGVDTVQRMDRGACDVAQSDHPLPLSV